MDIIKMDIKERDIFAKTLFFEAGSTCDIFEVLYVGFCIRNRVDGPKWYGKNYMEVCLKKYQFSCWNGKDINDIEKINMNGLFKWQMCLMAAEYIMRMPKKYIPFELKKCYHYIQPVLMTRMPSWIRKMKRCNPALRLKHIFLKEK